MNLKKPVWILDIRAFTIKIPRSATPLLLNFDLTFMNSECGLEVNGLSYVLIFTIFTRKQVDNINAVTRKMIKFASGFFLFCTKF